MRLVPRTWKGKLAGALAALTLTLVVYVVLTWAFWSAMSFVLAALLALVGGVLTLLTVAFLGYLVSRRRKLAGLRRAWVDERPEPPDAPERRRSTGDRTLAAVQE